MKDILIIANFCDYENKKGNNRFNYIAELITKKGYNVELVTSSFSHDRKIQRERIEDGKYKITLLKEPGYTKNISIRRFYSHYFFGNQVKRYLKDRKKPDVIYCAIPSLSGPYYVSKYCKQNGIRFVIDIQDLWPEAFMMIFNPPIIGKIIYKPFEIVANKIYSSANDVIAVSQTYIERAKNVNNKINRSYPIFLGTDLKTFEQNAIKNKIEKNTDKLLLGYCGTLGSSYDLTCVIDALEILNKENINTPKFIIMGDGPLKEKFEKYAQKKNVECEFTGRLPYDVMCGKLCACDMVVNPISKGAAQSIINKHADYAASGLPILNTQENKEYRDLITKYGMGFNCKNNDPIDLSEKLKILIQNSEMRIKMGKNAKRCAKEMFDRKESYNIIVDILTE